MTSATVAGVAGTGEMAARIAAFDWSKTAVGPMDQWPQSLRTGVHIILGSRYPMFIWWGEGLIKFYNDAYAQVLGRRHPAALGQSASQVWAEIWDVVGAQAQLVINQGNSTWNRDLLLEMTRNGYLEETYFTFSYSPITDDDGKVNGVFCACSEETPRVLSTRRLRTLRELAEETATAAAPETACSIAAEVLERNRHDVTFALIYVREGQSRRAPLMCSTGIAPGQSIAPAEIEIGGEENTVWPLTAAFESGGDIFIDAAEHGLPPLPGGPWPEHGRAAVVLPLPLSGPESIAGFLVAGLSPRLPYDEEYRGFLTLLARGVATAIDNARAYENERRRAEELAKLNRAKSTFFSNVSHEFRTPLTLLLGPVRELQAKLSDTNTDGTREALELMERNTLRLQKMVNTLLDFSKLEAGHATVRAEAVDLSRFTADLASIFRSAIERAGLVFHVDCPPLSGPVEVDREMWEKVVLNLLSNAVKFTREGEISVRLREIETGVQLTVQDSGTGIPPEELPRIFDRFYRVENQGGRTHEGTGIGLALVRELVELHRGSVEVQSRLGEGSTFFIRLPRLQHAAHAQEEAHTAARSSQREHFLSELDGWLPEPSSERAASQMVQDAAIAPLLVDAEKPRVLLADDNADMRQYAGRLLAEHYQVEVVNNGAEALEAIRRRIPDCVVTDVMMPSVNGFELLVALRTDQRTRALPVIMLSARAGEEARIEGLEAGADAYLVKPFSARELLVTVAGRIEIARLRAEANEREALLRSDADLARRDAMTILESIADPFYALDRDFRIVYLNREFERLAHYTREDLIGRNLLEAFPNVRGTIYEEKFREAMAQQRPLHFEAASLVQGSWLEVHAYPSSDRLAITFRDVTARKAVMQEAEFVASLNEILRTSKTPAEVLQRATKYVGRQLQVARCYYARVIDEGEFAIINQDYSDGLPSIAGSHRIRSFGEQVSRDLKQGKPLIVADVEQDPRTATPIGLDSFAAIQVRATLVLPLIKDGSLVCNFVVSHSSPRPWTVEDVRYAELAAERIWLAFEAASSAEALREREERLRLAARATNDAIWDWDLERHYVEWNDAVSALFGYDMKSVEPTGIWWADHLHPDDRERVLASISRVIDGTGENWSDEYRFMRADGTEAYVFDRGYVIRNSHGKAIRMIGAMQDLTDRKRAESERDELLQSLRANDRRKDEFLAMLAHELRNPLAAIRSAVSLNSISTSPEDRRWSDDVISRQVRQLARLVDDLLDVSRITEDKIRLQKEYVDAHGVLDRAVDVVRPLILERGHQLHVEYDRDAASLPIYVDPTRIEQVVVNLLTNSAKYTEAGGTITLKAFVEHGSSAQEPDDTIVISVQDNGIGIPPERLSEMFELFAQGERSMARSEGGLGLGLTIVRKLVEMHGGTVLAFSEGPGKGSTFTVRLPAAATHATTDLGVSAGPSAAPESSHPVANVLVVDDNKDTAVGLARLLRLSGHNVELAHDGIRAIELARELRPKFVLLDIGLPGKDGYEVARDLRQQPETQEVILIAISGYGQDDDRRASEQAGFDHHLVKPVDIDQLRELLRN